MTLGARSALAALARAAAGDHQNCAVRFNLAERPISLEAAGQRYGPPYGALATFEPERGRRLDAAGAACLCLSGPPFRAHRLSRQTAQSSSPLVTDAAPPARVQLEPADGRLQVAALPAGRFLGFVVADLIASESCGSRRHCRDRCRVIWREHGRRRALSVRVSGAKSDRSLRSARR